MTQLQVNGSMAILKTLKGPGYFLQDMQLELV
jgi:hypothetical protein